MLVILKEYKHWVWGLIESLESFNITHIPREPNIFIELLVTSTMNFLPLDHM